MSFEQLDLDLIQDVAQAKRAIIGLLNLVEDLQASVPRVAGRGAASVRREQPPEG